MSVKNDTSFNSNLIEDNSASSNNPKKQTIKIILTIISLLIVIGVICIVIIVLSSNSNPVNYITAIYNCNNNTYCYLYSTYSK